MMNIKKQGKSPLNYYNPYRCQILGTKAYIEEI